MILVCSSDGKLEIILSKQDIQVGEDVLMLCKASGEGEITWHKDGEEIDDDEKVYKLDETSSKLQINRATLQDSGRYICRCEFESGYTDETQTLIFIYSGPSFEGSVSYHEFLEGTDGLVPCLVSGQPAVDVVWLRDKLEIPQGSLMTSSLSFRRVWQQKDNTLFIGQVKREDAGMYVCQAHIRGRPIVQSLPVSVVINAPPKVHLREDVIKVLAGREANVSLICLVDGLPKPNITWTMPMAFDPSRHQFNSDRSELTIRAVTREDYGEYMCTAMNKIGESTATITLHVFEAPEVSVSPERQSVSVGDRVSVSCNVSGHPQPELHWLNKQNGLPIGQDSGRVRAVDGVLLIEDIVPFDGGLYSCMAVSSSGNASRDAAIHTPPGPPLYLSVSPGPSSVLFSLKTLPVNGGTPITSFVLQWKQSPNEQWNEMAVPVSGTLVIASLKPYTKYTVRLAALNAVGVGMFSDANIIRTQGIREPDSPILLTDHFKIVGNSFFIPVKQSDDGGSPLLNISVRYKQDSESAEWKETQLPRNANSVFLQNLSFGSDYDLEVMAINANGSSIPARFNFTIAEPPYKGSTLTKGTIVGIVLLIFLVVFLIVDATCCYKNHCGLLMTIAVKIFGQKVPGMKVLDEGDAPANGVKLKGITSRGSSHQLAQLALQASKDLGQHKETCDKAPLTKNEKKQAGRELSNKRIRYALKTSSCGHINPKKNCTMEDTDVEQVTLALLDAANDKDTGVQEQVRKSVLTLGKQQPERVLAMCQDYLIKHPKLIVSHRVVILRTIELIVDSQIEEISFNKIKIIISLASDEMTRSKDVIPDWQQAASNILVAVGNKHINDIMEEILSKFQPGILPHFFVVQTLANLSDSNVFGMVPFLNAILGTMLPMLAMAKQDNMKWVFSSALRHFCDSILEYLANLDKAPDPTVRKDTFSSEISAAFDILFQNWLQSREPKLRLTVAEALGSMCHLMARDKLEEHIPKLIPSILSLYKKHNNDNYIISKSLCQVLDASVNMGSRVLEAQLESLLFPLHHQVSIPVDYSNPPTVKNHNEVLRCFSLLANTFPSRLMMFVLHGLENSNERSRLGSLAVLRHLINSSISTMETKKLQILASIRQPMADHSNKVKKRVVQVISAMAHHGYLELEGGELLVRFIVQNCALPDTYHRGQRTTDPEEVTNEALRSMCDNTLHLLTTTVGQLADVLWPKLFYFLTLPQYSSATTPLCKSLVILGNKKKMNQESSFNIDFKQEVNLPTSQTLFIRLLVNAAFPFNNRGHGAPSLSLLQVLGNNIHPKMETLWDNEIPPLLTLLEESAVENLDKKKWEDKLLKFLSKTLATMEEDTWVIQLASDATQYLSTYKTALDEKSFLYRCIGVTLQHSFNKEQVKRRLHEMLLSAHHNDAIEREGVAMSVGLCANSHLEGTLAKLEDFGKSEAFKKSPSIFSLLKERNEVEVEKVKSTLILCYGQVALHAPPEKILNRIDNDILRNINKHFNTKVLGIKVETKDMTMKLSLIQSVGFIAKAISECVKKQGYVFTRKQELITTMLDFIKAETTDHLRTPMRHLVMTTCANLIALDPALSENETFDLLKTCVSNVFSLPPETKTPEKVKEDEILDPKQRQALFKDTIAALQDLLKSVLSRDPTPDGLQSVFKHIESWLSSAHDHERERAVSVTANILAYYLDILTVKNMVTFHNLGALLGRLSPRCTDPVPAVRTAAIDCLYTLLNIQLRYEGFALDYKDEGVDSLLQLKENLEHPDHAILYKTCSDITKVMSKRLPQQQLTTLIFMLFEGLVDSQINCCRASSVILNTLLKNRGGGLQELVPEMMEVLHVRLQNITEDQVRVAVGQTVLILASQHLQTVMNTLINQPFPYDSWTSEMWMALGSDPVIAKQIMEMVMEKLLILAPFVERKDGMIRAGSSKIATNQPLAMTCGLKDLLLNGQSQEPALSLFPQLFSCLIIRIGASVGVTAPKENAKQAGTVHVAGIATEALRILLARAQMDEVMKRLDEDNAWEAMKEPNTHISGITQLARAIAKHAGPRLPAIVECSCPSLNNIYESQRITVTAFFSELLNHHVATELMLIDVLMNNMMERISDHCSTVRMLAVRGLGNIAVGSPEKVNKYAKELLAAMSSGMEEKDDPDKLITLEAMSGLSKVLLHLDKKNVHLLVVYIFMKIKPFLESENDEIRCASIHLMGNLSKFGSGEPVFKDQIHNVLVSLLLHLVDPNPEVVKACKFAMRTCAPVVGSEQITSMFQNHLLEDKNLHYGEFINDLTKYLIQDFPSMLNFYHISVIQFFKSHWPQVRAGAAMFIGFLLGNLPEEHLSHLNMGTITKGLVMLLQDPDPNVRVKAAEAMGHFH
uniref:Uncharacterized protein n=1 Tax=Knipowitschia caucasica TaxID=637954 RepID=A0AAV2MBF0_KNICA